MIVQSLFYKPFVQKAKETIDNIIELTRTRKTPDVPLKLTCDIGKQLTFHEKATAFAKAVEFLKMKGYHQPQFGVRYGKPVKEHSFTELLFTMGVKNTVGECHFSMDTNGAPIVYCLSVVNVGVHLTSDKGMRGTIDPYSFIPIPLQAIKERYSHVPSYREFMELLGNTARV